MKTYFLKTLKIISSKGFVFFIMVSSFNYSTFNSVYQQHLSAANSPVQISIKQVTFLTVEQFLNITIQTDFCKKVSYIKKYKIGVIYLPFLLVPFVVFLTCDDGVQLLRHVEIISSNILMKLNSCLSSPRLISGWFLYS